MPLLLKKYVNTVLIIITVPLILFLSCLMFLTPLVVFTVILYSFCVGNRPIFSSFILQKLIIHDTIRTSSVSSSLLSTPSSNLRLTTSSPRTQPYVLTLTSISLLHHVHTVTPPTHKPLTSYSLPSPKVSPSPSPPSVCEAFTSSSFSS